VAIQRESTMFLQALAAPSGACAVPRAQRNRRIRWLKLLQSGAWLFACSAPLATLEETSEVSRLHRSGSSIEAVQLADKILTTRPKDVQMRFLKGVVLAESQRAPEAIEVFQGLTEEFPELAEPYNNLAALHAARGDYERARVALEQALRSNPSYATAHENLGDVHGMLASRAYAKALTLDPSNERLPGKLALVRELFIAKRAAAAPAKPQ
jgi:tetratricopeptide (TPR) repeat protein